MDSEKTINCTQTSELASDYVEGRLPASTARTVEEHARTCAGCRADLEAFRQVWDELSALTAVEPPLFFRENVMFAIEQRQRDAARQRVPAWRLLLPHLGRVALGTAATGLAVAAVAWTLLLPSTLAPATQTAGSGGVPAGLPERLPGALGPGAARRAAPAASAARLVIQRTTVVDPVSGPSYEFGLRLQNAARGTASVRLLPREGASAGTLVATGVERAPVVARFHLEAGGEALLRVPFAAVPGDEAVSLYVRWTGDGEAHTTYLFVSIPRNDVPPAARQSFGLPVLPLAGAARAVAIRYGQPVRLEMDAAAAARPVSVVPRRETALEALTRALDGTGLAVAPAEVAEGGLRIAPAAVAPPLLPAR